MILYYRMSEERVQSSKFEVKIMSPDEFAGLNPAPERLQELVYSIYTCDGIPRSVVPQESSPTSRLYKKSDKKTAFIVATCDAERLLRSPTTEHLKNIEPELRNYKSLAGFFKVEWGVYKPGKNLPIEAMVLTKNYPWPVDTVVSHAASFTTNPLLPKQARLEILKDMLSTSYALASTEGFSDQIFTILAPHVAAFVEASGITTTKVSEANELSDDSYAKCVFETFPGYWAIGPALYRFVPNKNR